MRMQIVAPSIDEIESLKLEQARLSQQCLDAQRREKILMRRLANKEQEFQDYVSQIAEYKAAQAPTGMALRSALLDPAVNLLFEKLKKELKATKAKLEETQNELSAWKFTPDSNTGKRLIAKCRLLYQENEELGKMTSNGRLAKLETELAMQKSFCEEVKKSQSEVDDFLPELDEDVEGMQSTILFLQQELKTTRDRIQTLEKENYQLKTGTVDSENNVKSEDVIADVDITDGNSSATLHVGLNGTDVPVNMTIIKTDVENCAMNYSNNSEIITTNTNNNANNNILLPVHTAPLHTHVTELKYNPTLPLETIDENATLRSAYAIPNELYNGNVDDQQQPQQQPSQILETENNAIINPFNANSNAIATNALIRTVASRKRNYDGSESVENPAIMTVVVPPTPTHVIAPRTLPPKKSKLRRSSIQTNDITEYDATANNTVIGSNVQLLNNCNTTTSSIPVIDPLNIVDNAVVGMANEEHPSMTIDESVMADSVNAGGVALRIMTRRRSVRQQQNGNIGGDSNH